MSAKFMSIRRGDHWWLTIITNGRVWWLYKQGRVGDRICTQGRKNANV